MTARLVDRLVGLSDEALDALLDGLPASAMLALAADLEHAQGTVDLLPHQKPPEDSGWDLWVCQAGRGAGKTQAICHYLNQEASKAKVRCRIIAPTLGDAVESCVDGVSGVLAQNPSVEWRPSAPGGSVLVWPNGSRALVIGTPTLRDVQRLRAAGNRHLDVWEEMAANPMLAQAWDQAQLGLRLGEWPRSVAATTPTPHQTYRDLVARPKTRVSRAHMDDNPYLSEVWRESMHAAYGGTHLGRQELEGEIVDEVEGALWTLASIAAHRVDRPPVDVVRSVVAVDPSGTTSGDEQGIVAACKAADGRYYVLGDWSCRLSPEGWASRTMQAAEDVDADAILWESNYGGDMVESTLKNAGIERRLKKVVASRGKALRAEPVSLLYERGLVSHVGEYPKLEGQMTGWVPGGPSPDRLDALVFCLTELAGVGGEVRVRVPSGRL